MAQVTCTFFDHHKWSDVPPTAHKSTICSPNDPCESCIVERNLSTSSSLEGNIRRNRETILSPPYPGYPPIHIPSNNISRSRSTKDNHTVYSSSTQASSKSSMVSSTSTLRKSRHRSSCTATSSSSDSHNNQKDLQTVKTSPSTSNVTPTKEQHDRNTRVDNAHGISLVSNNKRSRISNNHNCDNNMVKNKGNNQGECKTNSKNDNYVKENDNAKIISSGKKDSSGSNKNMNKNNEKNNDDDNKKNENSNSYSNKNNDNTITTTTSSSNKNENNHSINNGIDANNNNSSNKISPAICYQFLSNPYTSSNDVLLQEHISWIQSHIKTEDETTDSSYMNISTTLPSVSSSASDVPVQNDDSCNDVIDITETDEWNVGNANKLPAKKLYRLKDILAKEGDGWIIDADEDNVYIVDKGDVRVIPLNNEVENDDGRKSVVSADGNVNSSEISKQAPRKTEDENIKTRRNNGNSSLNSKSKLQNPHITVKSVLKSPQKCFSQRNSFPEKNQNADSSKQNANKAFKSQEKGPNLSSIANVSSSYRTKPTMHANTVSTKRTRTSGQNRQQFNPSIDSSSITTSSGIKQSEISARDTKTREKVLQTQVQPENSTTMIQKESCMVGSKVGKLESENLPNSQTNYGQGVTREKERLIGENSPSINTGDNFPSTTPGDCLPSINTAYNPQSINNGDNPPSIDVGGDNLPSTDTDENPPPINTGVNPPSINTGDNAPSFNTGDNPPSINTEHNAPSTNTGDNLPSMNTEHNAPSTNTGDNAPSTNTGDNHPIINAGDNPPLINNGEKILNLSGEEKQQIKEHLATACKDAESFAKEGQELSEERTTKRAASLKTQLMIATAQLKDIEEDQPSTFMRKCKEKVSLIRNNEQKIPSTRNSGRSALTRKRHVPKYNKSKLKKSLQRGRGREKKRRFVTEEEFRKAIEKVQQKKPPVENLLIEEKETKEEFKPFQTRIKGFVSDEEDIAAKFNVRKSLNISPMVVVNPLSADSLLKLAGITKHELDDTVRRRTSGRMQGVKLEWSPIIGNTNPILSAPTIGTKRYFGETFDFSEDKKGISIIEWKPTEEVLLKNRRTYRT